jgi:hypothetical protein
MHHVIDVQDILVASAFILVPLGILALAYAILSSIDFSH